MGIVRENGDAYFASLTHDKVKQRLEELNISSESDDTVVNASRTRHIKIWHDHSSIANLGYLLVMVSLIYDPAFFYTRQEITDIVRFFHGDGPAAQFEAGNKQGGHYCCVGCGAHSGRFSDIAYCYICRRGKNLFSKGRLGGKGVSV